MSPQILNLLVHRIKISNRNPVFSQVILNYFQLPLVEVVEALRVRSLYRDVGDVNFCAFEVYQHGLQSRLHLTDLILSEGVPRSLLQHADHLQ
jgi:hypothetical protein